MCLTSLHLGYRHVRFPPSNAKNMLGNIWSLSFIKSGETFININSDPIKYLVFSFFLAFCLFPVILIRWCAACPFPVNCVVVAPVPFFSFEIQYFYPFDFPMGCQQSWLCFWRCCFNFPAVVAVVLLLSHLRWQVFSLFAAWHHRSNIRWSFIGKDTITASSTSLSLSRNDEKQ